jgi:hypothetical protein
VSSQASRIDSVTWPVVDYTETGLFLLFLG